MKSKVTIRTLTFAALFIALDIVFTRFFSRMVFYDRISLQFLPHVMAGGMLGPIGAALTCVAGDLLGMLINSGGLSINPILTGTAMLRGLLYGLFLFRKGKISFWRMLLAVGIVTLLCDVVINTYVMHVIYEVEVKVILASKLWIRALAWPLYSLVAWGVWNRLEKAGQIK
ncbi:MAG TPA: folate family ECF transporter S component [Clostridiales bacterium]|jgi:ECF transporter S component (folate family)|nr:folate family ECF transporter S component [Clostridiales bacterium]